MTGAPWIVLTLIVEAAVMGAFNDFKPEDQARAEMRRYVFEYSPQLVTFPRRVDPKVAESFVSEQLRGGAALKPAEVQRMMLLAGYYDTKAIVPELVKRLDRSEKTDADVRVSLIITHALAVLGGAAEQATAADYYLHLLAGSSAETNIQGVLSCLAEVYSDQTAAATEKRMDQVLSALQARAANDAAVGASQRDYEAIRRNDLPRVAGAVAVRKEVMAIPDAADRGKALAKIYLSMDARYSDYTKTWAIRMLLRQARTQGAAGVASAFRAVLPPVPPPDKPNSVDLHNRAVALAAIEYFGGALSPEEVAETKTIVRTGHLLSDA